MLLRSVGCHKLGTGVWGEAPAANGFLAHKRRIIGDLYNAHIQLLYFSQVSVNRLYTSPGRY